MTCHEARDLFSARVDGELAADEARGFDAHLAGCDDCRREWARFERVVSLAQAVPPAHAPAGFVDRVLREADPTPWLVRFLRGAFTPLRMKLPLQAAALVLVGGLAVMIFQRSPELQQVARHDSAAPQAPAAPSPATPQPDATPPAPAIAPPAPAAAPRAPAVASRETAAPPGPASVGARALESDAKSADRAAKSADRSSKSQVAPAGPPPAPSAGPPAPGPPAPAPPAAATPSPPVPQPSVAQEPRETLGAAARREATVKSTAAPLSVRERQPGPDVSAWVTVADRAAALKALAETVTRHGGRESARRPDGRADIVEVAIPREAYDAFIRDVSRLGGFALQRQTPDLPASVSVSLRITD